MIKKSNRRSQELQGLMGGGSLNGFTRFQGINGTFSGDPVRSWGSQAGLGAFPEVLESFYGGFHGCSKDVSMWWWFIDWVFLRISAGLKGVPRIAGGFMGILGGTLQRFSGVPGGFKGVLGRSDSVSVVLKGFQKVSRGVSGYFRKFQDEVLRKYQGVSRDVPGVFQGIPEGLRGARVFKGLTRSFQSRSMAVSESLSASV